MRQIRFRGKRKNKGEWVYGYVTIVDGEAFIQEQNPMRYPPDDEVVIETVGQYTGLRDKNGVEIYEGDMVIYEEPTEPITSYTIEFTDYLGRWSGLDENGYTPMLACFNTFCEVIGNIHDKED